MKKLSFAIITLLALGFHGTFAQTSSSTATVDIPAYAKLGFSGVTSLTMPLLASNTAGSEIVAPTNNSTLWLNYSSITTTAVSTYTIKVKIGAVIPGVNINLTAATPVMTNGSGAGGTGSASQVITAIDQPIVTGIGSCQTGAGDGSGSNLTYAVSVNKAAYASLVKSTPVVTVTYTMAE